MKKRILLVDDHKIVRDAIGYYFEGDEKYELADEARNGVEALELLKNNTYDVIVTDISMPEMDGVELASRLVKEYPDIPVLVISMMDSYNQVKKMLSMGVTGYILKDTGKSEMIKALDEVLKGNSYYSKELYTQIMNAMAGVKPKKRLSVETDLSIRELEVLNLILQEKSNQEIAEELFISVRTVEGHKRSMLTKTGCKNMVGLTMYAVENNLIN